MAGEPERPLSVDLVLATVGRRAELERFLSSLDAQTHRDFRLIVVDQNDDDRLERLLGSLGGSFDVLHLRSAPGLSRARNVALPHVRADVVAFPDDDCTYPRELLQRVAELVGARDGVSVRSVDAAGRPSNMRWDSSPGLVDRRNLWRRAISYTLFLRRHVIEQVGDFDEQLGVGSGTRWTSGEESDYLLRALAAGFRIAYEPSLHVVHESPRPAFDSRWRARGFGSGAGHGRVLRKHGYPWWFAAWRTAQVGAGAGAFLALARPAQASFYAAMAAGRAAGWLRPGT